MPFSSILLGVGVEFLLLRKRTFKWVVVVLIGKVIHQTLFWYPNYIPKHVIMGFYALSKPKTRKIRKFRKKLSIGCKNDLKTICSNENISC